MAQLKRKFCFVQSNLLVGNYSNRDIVGDQLFLLQPFRGNPDYDTVADLPFDTECLEKLTHSSAEIHITSINKCRMETMYRTSCLADKLINSSQVLGLSNNRQIA